MRKRGAGDGAAEAIFYDTVVVGTGVAGCFAALHLPQDSSVLMITKAEPEESNSFLAQGGICVLKDEADYSAFFNDTMRAGHYENRPEAVDIMIRFSRGVIEELIGLGVSFTSEDGRLCYTKEGAHSAARILYHDDATGREITGVLLEHVRSRANITLRAHTAMVDIIERENVCRGVVVREASGRCRPVFAANVIWACGGIGGICENSTNYRHITGDALGVALKHGIRLKNLDYIQIHPTTLYSEEPGRRFLISESVRGEGAVLYDKHGRRFVDELLPRDRLSEAIFRQMEKDETPHVWLSMMTIGGRDLRERFPNIAEYCRKAGYDVTKEWIPVVPSQHYFMGGVEVDSRSRTSMKRLYAVGETSCNGVHGANRLASNSLLESLIFAKRAAEDIASDAAFPPGKDFFAGGAKAEAAEAEARRFDADLSQYSDAKRLSAESKRRILLAIEAERKEREALRTK